jgi:hypothetical protein
LGDLKEGDDSDSDDDLLWGNAFFIFVNESS